MAGVVVNDQLCIREAARHVVGVDRWHHDVVVTIGQKNRSADAAQILWGLVAPSVNGLKLLEESPNRRFLVATFLPLLQPRQKGICSATSVRCRREEQIELGIPAV